MISWRKQYISLAAFAVLLAAVWETAVRLEWWSAVLVPSPLEVVRYLGRSLWDGTLPAAGLVTVRRLLAGYVLGLAIGVPLGILNARFQIMRSTIGVVGLGLQTLPSVCWAPLAVVWFGQTEAAMLFIVTMGSVWSVALATDAGIRNVSPVYIRAARTMGSKGIHTLVKVVVPAALPFIVNGMKLGWAFAWRSLMAAEIYITVLSGLGLGHLLHYGRELHAMDAVMGIMLVIIFIGLAVDRLVFARIEQRLRARWGMAGA